MLRNIFITPNDAKFVSVVVNGYLEKKNKKKSVWFRTRKSEENDHAKTMYELLYHGVT